MRGTTLAATAGLRYLLYSWLLLSCSAVAGQEAGKKIPQPEDYKLWHRLELLELSDDHQWVLYKSAAAESDTLIVKATRSKTRHVFPNTGYGAFFGSSCLAYRDGKGVHVLDLKTGRRKRHGSARNFVTAGGQLGILEKNETGERLMILNERLREIESVEGLLFCKEHVATQSLAVSGMLNGSGFVKIVQLSRGRPRTLSISLDSIQASHLTWSEDGGRLAFIGTLKGTYKLYDYSVAEGILRVMGESLIPSDIEISKNFPLQYSTDGRRLFFKGRSKNALPKNGTDAVQVWNTADKWIHPSEQVVMGFTRTAYLMMWELEEHRFLQITDKEQPHGVLTPDAGHALTSNPKTYEPQFKTNADRDYHITDLSTGRRTLFLTRQAGNESRFFCSPDSKLIAYHRDGSWFAYDVKANRHQPLTTHIATSFSSNDHANLPASDGFGGWTSDGLAILLYDAHDLWIVNADGSKQQRLTRGREEGMVYRVLTSDNQAASTAYAPSALALYNPARGLLLKVESVDHSIEGIYRLDASLKLSKVYCDRKRIYNFYKKGNDLLWIAERHNAGPSIYHSKNNGRPTVLATSNKHLDHYAEQRMDVVHYTSATGKALRGLLYYPAGYIPGRTYPMVTQVYEMQSDKIHHFLTPNLRDEEGFSTGHYVNKGYFVLLPDVEHTTDLPGPSAVWCVEAAVAAAEKVAPIDMKRLGLIGHSFGGYQADYIITQTDLFACAVAGSAITNFASSALAVSTNDKKPNMYKFEDGQARMGSPLAENPAAYISNSPIYHVKHITTPLLGWTGLEDNQVEWRQSFEMYMAMRWAAKPHILLAYPNEGHGLEKPKNIADLHSKIDAWFDHYLKDVPKPSWMQPTE